MECDEEAATLRKEKLEAAQCKLTQAQGLLQAGEPRHAQVVLVSEKAHDRLAVARRVAAWQARARSVADLRTCSKSFDQENQEY